MADKYAPALVLEVLAFWLVLRWLLTGRAVLLVGRALVLMMLVGVLASLDEHHIVWATFFGGAALLAGAMLRRWRGHAAVPATIAANPPSLCVLALAGDGVWVLEDDSRVRLAQVGRVLACWDRAGLVAYLEHSRRGERLELSWPRNGALVRGVMPSGAPADLFAGHLAADELRLNR